MPVIRFTQEMIESAAPWGEGWHKATFVEMEEEASKNKDSINSYPTFEYGWKSDGSHVPGKMTSKFACVINDKNKAMYFRQMGPLYAALTGGKPTVGESSAESFYGTELWVEIKTEEWKGNLNEKVKGFAAKGNVPF